MGRLGMTMKSAHCAFFLASPVAGEAGAGDGEGFPLLVDSLQKSLYTLIAFV